MLKMPNFVEYARNDLYSITSHFFPPACSFSILLLCNHPYVCFCIKGKAGYVAQGSNCARDRARNPLFTYVNEDKLKSIETYARTFLLIVFVFPFSRTNASFLTSISNTQISLTCWTTMRCLLEYQRRWLRRSFRRTGSSLIQSWRQMWWRCSKTSREEEKALSTNRQPTDPAQPLFTLLVKIKHVDTCDIYTEMKNR